MLINKIFNSVPHEDVTPPSSPNIKPIEGGEDSEDFVD